jgi:DNA adenine methylase
MKRITSPLKWHGGKHYLSSKIVAMMPPHTHYVEPYAGGLSVLLAKHCEDVSEIVNDIDGDLSNFWSVLQSPDTFAEFVRLVDATPFSEREWLNHDFWNRGIDPVSQPVEACHNFFVRCRQSLAGRMESFAAVSRNRTRRGMNEQVSAWLTAIEGLSAVHARLRRVLILKGKALDVIRQQDGPKTLFYLDPPYLPETRTCPNVYKHEMTKEQHAELCDTVCKCEGKVILSGYPSELYHQMLELKGWKRRDFRLPNNSAGGKTKRRMTESVWCNF